MEFLSTPEFWAGLIFAVPLSIIASIAAMKIMPRIDTWWGKWSTDRRRKNEQKQREFDQRVTEVMKSTHNLIAAYARLGLYETRAQANILSAFLFMVLGIGTLPFWETLPSQSTEIKIGFFVSLFIMSLSMIMLVASIYFRRKYWFLSEVLGQAYRLANPEDDQGPAEIQPLPVDPPAN